MDFESNLHKISFLNVKYINNDEDDSFIENDELTLSSEKKL